MRAAAAEPYPAGPRRKDRESALREDGPRLVYLGDAMLAQGGCSRWACSSATSRAQLGHADVAVTARHHAKWVEGDTYRDPMPLLPGEVPVDLLDRVVEGAEDAAYPEGSHQKSHHVHS